MRKGRNPKRDPLCRPAAPASDREETVAPATNGPTPATTGPTPATTGPAPVTTGPAPASSAQHGRHHTTSSVSGKVKEKGQNGALADPLDLLKLAENEKRKVGSSSSDDLRQLSTKNRNWFDDRFYVLLHNDNSFDFWNEIPKVGAFAYLPDAVVERYIYSGIVLGFGSQTSVHEVVDRVDGKSYAMKKIRCTTQDFEKRKIALQQEIEVMERLSHETHTPGFGRVTTFIRAHIDDTKRVLYLILSPVAEKSLRDVVSNKSDFRPEHTQDYHAMFRDLANGLSHIHECSVRHKDIKPENILVYKDRLMYADFGISRIIEGESGTTEGPTTDFTIPYAAPEVIDKQPRNKKSDVFCLGAVFYEILGNYVGVLELQGTCYGSPDFRGYGRMAKTGTLKQKIESARNKYLCIKNQRSHWEQVLLEYLAVIERMLLVAHNERPNANEIALDVQRILNRLGPRYFSRPRPSDSGGFSIWARRIGN